MTLIGWRAWVWLMVVGLVLVLPTGLAWAHGGGVPQLTNVDVGPYWVSVWMQPDPPRVGQVHITVAVAEPGGLEAGRREAGPPVLDAMVQVQFEALEHAGAPFTSAATHEGATNKLLYEADLELPEPGRWRVVIAVEGPQGTGSATFEMQVSPRATFNWTWIWGLGLVALASTGLVQRYRGQSKDA